MAFLGSIGRAGLAAAILLWSAGQPVHAQQSATEQDVKAAYLYNFTKFVTWPSDAPRDTQPFRICVVADPQSTEAVERMMRGETVGGRPLQTVAPKSREEAASCQVLFVSKTARDKGAPLLAAVRNLPVLTVSDADGFASRDGAIQFVLESGRLKFDINPENARGGLSISSRLLRVARKVK